MRDSLYDHPVSFLYRYDNDRRAEGVAMAITWIRALLWSYMYRIGTFIAEVVKGYQRGCYCSNVHIAGHTGLYKSQKKGGGYV